jgi:hypothetical protein
MAFIELKAGRVVALRTEGELDAQAQFTCQ